MVMKEPVGSVGTRASESSNNSFTRSSLKPPPPEISEYYSAANSQKHLSIFINNDDARGTDKIKENPPSLRACADAYRQTCRRERIIKIFILGKCSRQSVSSPFIVIN